MNYHKRFPSSRGDLSSLPLPVYLLRIGNEHASKMRYKPIDQLLRLNCSCKWIDGFLQGITLPLFLCY